MKELKAVAIFVIILVVLGAINIYLSIFFSYSGFNFYKSEITINDNKVLEKLFYDTDDEYHTLYRTFVSPLYVNESTPYLESIEITSVLCQNGEAYAYSNNRRYFSFNQNSFQSSEPELYTERNEYGCTFGNVYGFKENNDYWIQAQYNVNGNLFKINDNYYWKFVAYSPNKHKLLIRDKTLFISSNKEVITKDIFLPHHYVIIYIPYEGDISGYNIIEKNNFEFDNTIFSVIVLFVFSFIPAFLFFIIWFYFGREKVNPDLPNELSMYPNERKAWEVATIFNPPLGSIGKNFFSSMIMDFYRRKIIDLKSVGKEVYIKILNYNKKDLDEVELAFVLYLEKIKELGKKDKIDKEGFFKVKEMVDSISFLNKLKIQKQYEEITKTVSKKSKDYLSKTGVIMANLVIFPLFLLGMVLMVFFPTQFFFVFLIISFFIFSFVTFCSSIFIRFNKDYYIEYQKWQGFRRYIKSFSTMKSCPPQALKLWQQHLVYATALGVSGVIIKKFKDWKVIDQNHYNMYHTATAFSSSSFGNTGGGSSGGGMGGAGGGGSGGGGGGGR